MVEDIGKLIRETRKRRRLTQKELALKLGISNSFLCEIEKGKNRPSLTTLEKLVKVLNISDKDIFFGKKIRK